MLKRRRWRVLLPVAFAAVAIGCLLHDWEDRGPIYQGRHIADWVADALKESPSQEACDVVIELGAPAVPFIVKQGLHNPSHKNPRLAFDVVDAFCDNHPLLGRLALGSHLLKLHNCVSEHGPAGWLLSQIGTNAVAAVPDVIDCIEHCPNAHFLTARDLLDTLSDICGTDPAALAYLTKTARQTNSFSLHAAAYAYQLTNDTNLMVQTLTALGPRIVGGKELFWFSDDHALNQYVVPMFERLYDAPNLGDEDRSRIMSHLESRGDDATAAIARLLARQTNAPSQ